MGSPPHPSLDLSGRTDPELSLESEDCQLRYRRLFENAPVVAYSLDNHLRTLYISPYCQKVFGYSDEEIQKDDLFPSSSSSQTTAIVSGVVASASAAPLRNSSDFEAQERARTAGSRNMPNRSAFVLSIPVIKRACPFPLRMERTMNKRRDVQKYSPNVPR